MAGIPTVGGVSLERGEGSLMTGADLLEWLRRCEADDGLNVRSEHPHAPNSGGEYIVTITVTKAS